MRRGVTLAECMVASAVLGLLVLVLLSGVTVATRIADDNAQLLAAEAVAWDAAWKRFNEDYRDLVLNETTGWQNLSSNAAPVLSVYDTPACISNAVFDIVDVIDPEDVEGWRGELKAIIVDVEWGPSEHRRRLSDTRHAVQVWRGNMGRTP